MPRTMKQQGAGKRQTGRGCPVPTGATTRYFKSSCNASNVHNTHPEADLSLVQGKGVLPGLMQGGTRNESSTNVQHLEGMNVNQSAAGYGPQKAGGCPTPQAAPITFKQYLSQLSDKIGGVDNYTAGVGGSLEHSIDAAHHGSQSGGSGYSVNPEKMVGGLPVIVPYDRTCPPAIIGSKLVQSATGEAICGNQIGAGKKKTKASKKSKASKKTKRVKKSKASKKSKTSQKTKKAKRRQRGGLAPLPKAHDGKNSDFDYLPEGKDFGARQPNWEPNAR